MHFFLTVLLGFHTTFVSLNRWKIEVTVWEIDASSRLHNFDTCVGSDANHPLCPKQDTHICLYADMRMDSTRTINRVVLGGQRLNRQEFSSSYWEAHYTIIDEGMMDFKFAYCQVTYERMDFAETFAQHRLNAYADVDCKPGCWSQTGSVSAKYYIRIVSTAMNKPYRMFSLRITGIRMHAVTQLDGSCCNSDAKNSANMNCPLCNYRIQFEMGAYRYIHPIVYTPRNDDYRVDHGILMNIINDNCFKPNANATISIIMDSLNYQIATLNISSTLMLPGMVVRLEDYSSSTPNVSLKGTFKLTSTGYGGDRAHKYVEFVDNKVSASADGTIVCADHTKTSPPLCNQDICTSHRPCLNGGACINYNNNFDCICQSNYYGTRCEMFACTKYCKNGYCSGLNTCTCYPGWTGNNCDVATCTNNDRCVHGECIEYPNNTLGCLCDSRKQVGEYCEISCPHTCVHGICSIVLGVESCSCDNGWMGDKCDLPIDATYLDKFMVFQTHVIDMQKYSGSKQFIISIGITIGVFVIILLSTFILVWRGFISRTIRDSHGISAAMTLGMQTQRNQQEIDEQDNTRRDSYGFTMRTMNIDSTKMQPGFENDNYAYAQDTCAIYESDFNITQKS